MTLINRRWTIAGRPVGRDVNEADFKLEQGEAQDPADGQVLVRVDLLAFEPSMKGQMENIGGYAARTEIGDTMRGAAIGTVAASHAESVPVGATVLGPFGWQEYATVPASAVRILDAAVPPSAHLGVLGVVGLTAYFGMKHVGQPFPGDTLVVTGAAGGVGAVVVQLAKLAGCRVIGVAGGAAKCRMLTDELGADEAIDYKAQDLSAELARLAPDGVDVVWDNIGGVMLNDILAHLALHARVVICGGISRSKTGGMPVGPSNYFNLVFKRATMRGILLNDYESEFAAGRARLAAWLAAGKLVAREDVQVGFENAPKTLMRLFSGANVGKQLLRLKEGQGA